MKGKFGQELYECKKCGIHFELGSDYVEHMRCHVPEVKTAPNSHPEDGGPKLIAWEEQ